MFEKRKRERLVREIRKCMTLPYALAILRELEVSFDAPTPLEEAAILELKCYEASLLSVDTIGQ